MIVLATELELNSFLPLMKNNESILSCIVSQKQTKNGEKIKYLTS